MWKTTHLSDFYEVSTLGEIRRKGKHKALKPMLNQHGYHRVEIHGVATFVHRLVASAFIPNPLNLSDVNHKNGIKTDNRLDNLEWVNRGDNQRHAYKLGLKNGKGVKNKAAKLNDEKVRQIRAKSLKWCGFTAQTLASEYGVYRGIIEKIRSRKLWPHV